MSTTGKAGAIRIVSILGAMLGLIGQAHGVLVEHNGGTVFFDDFESAPVVVSDPSDLSAADPVAVTGSWILNENDGSQNPNPAWIQVTDSGTHVVGPAARGNNFLHIRSSKSSPNTFPPDTLTTRPNAEAQFSSSATGGTLYFDLMYRNNNIAAGDTEIQMTLINPAGTFGIFAGPILRANPSDGTWHVFINNVTSTVSTGIAIASDENWHRVEMDVDMDTGLYSVTIDGTTSATFNSGVANITATGLKFGPAGFGTGTTSLRFDLDAVPEPSSLALASLGVLMMLRRRRR